MESKGISRTAFLAQAKVLLVGLLGASVARAAETSQKKTSGGDKPAATAIPPQTFGELDKKSQEQRVQELIDREEIEDLIHRYAICAGQGEGKLMADLFIENGWVKAHIPDQSAPQLNARNRAEIAEAYSDMRWGITIPTIHNTLIAVSGDTASGICSIEIRQLAKGQSMIGSGYYEDKFKRENGRWKFASREATFFHWVPLQKGWAGTPPVKPG